VALTEIAFRLQHDCPYNDLTRKHPEALIALWCNYGIHVFEIACKSPELFQAVQEDLERLTHHYGARTLHKAFTGTNLQLVVQQCHCTSQPHDGQSITDVFETHNSLEIPPTIYTGGWERYRILTFDQTDTKRMFNVLSKIATFEILERRPVPSGAVRDTFVVSTSRLFAGLTAKQTEALRAAFERGYYRVPKHISTEVIAQQVHVPRTTYEEHLRKAESKVLSAIAPYLQLGANAAGRS
jgi:predicted DNA binding protein